jgi:hypothetical protein
LSTQGWLHYSFEVAAGEHTFTWSYTKDSSVNPTGDYFAIDNVVLGYPVEPDYVIVENIADFTYTFTDLEYETYYFVQVQGKDAGCIAGTEWTDAVSFFFPLPTQTIELVEGWNWFSTYIEADPYELLEQLKESLGDNAIQIQSMDYVTEYDGEEWFGDLDDEGIYNEQTYMIEVVTPCTIQLHGVPANVENYTIEIRPNGYTWIGFPSAVALDIAEAMFDFEAEEGDQIECFDGMTEFDGEEWFGDIDIFESGKGYVYLSNSDETKYLTFLTGAKAIRVLGNVKSINGDFGLVKKMKKTSNQSR